jgi:hypothetical protein
MKNQEKKQYKCHGKEEKSRCYSKDTIVIE